MEGKRERASKSVGISEHLRDKMCVLDSQESVKSHVNDVEQYVLIGPSCLPVRCKSSEEFSPKGQEGKEEIQSNRLVLEP